jgi:hypothetical protein
VSPNALSVANQTVVENHKAIVQEVVTPLGLVFKIITLKYAYCAKLDQWSPVHSWFPGYAWKLCLCPSCKGHLGWMFEPEETATFEQKFPSDKGFYALIYNQIISEKCKYDTISNVK